MLTEPGKTPRRGHEVCVDRWLERSLEHDSPIALASLLNLATDALWERARSALGSVTLTAIVMRVFHRAETQFPFLSNAHGKVAPHRVELDRFTGVPPARLIEGMRFLLVELLAAIGKLTAEILTPELHAALHEATPKAVEPIRHDVARAHVQT